MARGIAQQVFKRPPHRLGPQPHRAARPVHRPKAYRLPCPHRIGHHQHQERGRIHLLGGLHRIASGKGQKLIDHPLHLLDIALQRLDLLLLGQEGQPQLKPRQRCAQIMADPRQHLRARLDLTFDPQAHVQECLPRCAHLGRAPRPEGHDLALAKGLGGLRHARNRRQLVAQKDVSHTRHQDRGEHHQHQKLMRV